MKTLLAQVEFDIRSGAASAELPGSDTASAADAGFYGFVGRVMGTVMGLAGLLLLVYLIWGAIDWITSGGDSGKIASARNKIIQAVLGLIVLSSVVAIMIVVQGFIGAELISFGG